MLSAVGEEVENPPQRGLLETSQMWEELHPQLVPWAAMWASHQVQVPQKSALKSAGVHSDTVWNKGRYITSLSLSLNMRIDVGACRSGLLRRSGFNKTASEGELEGSNPNVNFPTFCECLLTLTLNPLEGTVTGTTTSTQGQGKPHTWVSSGTVCILASTFSAIYFQFISAYRLKRKSEACLAEQLSLSFLLC